MNAERPGIAAARIVFPSQDREEIAAMIEAALAAGALTLGALTEEFETAFAHRHPGPDGPLHAVAVNSGTAALEIILRSLGDPALGLGGGEVVVPTNTFYATAGAVVHAGGVPRFADVDARTLALGPATLEAALTPRTVGVIAVHIGGLVSPDINALKAICDNRGIWLVEDAAHAHGSRFDGRSAGSFGTAAAFSFYPTKVITSGEGGMIVTADENLSNDAKMYRDQGKSGFLGGDHVRMGYAWRLSELHAAIGISQMKRLDEFISVRQRVAGHYDKALDSIDGIQALTVPDACFMNYYKYLVMLDPSIDRDALKQELREHHRVSLSGEVYAKPLHQQPILAAFADGPLPVAEAVCRSHACLPVFSDMTDAQADRVVEALAQAVRAPGVRR